MTYVLSGANAFLLQDRKRQLTQDFIEKYGDLAYEQLDCEEVEVNKIRESLESLPFLASKKLVVLLQPSANKDFVTVHKDVLPNVPESTDVIIIEPKPDKRSSYYKFLKKQQGYEEFAELDAGGLARWATSYVKKWQAKIDSAAARELVLRVGTDQLRLKNELDKLSMYTSDIDIEAVQTLTVSAPSSTIFELLDAAFVGNKTKAMQLYQEQRTLNVDPMQIIAMLGWQFHILATIKASQGKPSREIASEAKINPFVVQKTENIAAKLSMQRIKELIHALRVLDERLKTTKLNADDAIQAYLLSLAA